MALAIEGPYSHMRKTRPANFLRIARWFSPWEQSRPVLNPTVDVSFTAEFGSQPDHDREPLLIMGYQPYRYILFAEHSSNGLRFVSSMGETPPIITEIAGRDDMQADVRVTYAPESGELTAMVNRQQIAVHQVPTLMLAPAEVTFGENRVEPGMTSRRFKGKIRDESTIVRPVSVGK
jgi:hypothetical protein